MVKALARMRSNVICAEIDRDGLLHRVGFDLAKQHNNDKKGDVMTDEILCHIEESVMSVSLNRPDRKNALNFAMYTALADCFEQAIEASDVRVVLLKGLPGCFTSGNDLADFASGANLSDADNPIARFIRVLGSFPKPVVVAVDGVAVGIGTTLLLHSDLVYASESSSFRLPFVNLGLSPEFASSLVLPRLAGHVKAAEWLLLGEFFSASEALAGGILNAIVDDPVAVAEAQARKLAKQPPAALRSAKALMKAPDQALIKEVIHSEYQVFSEGLKGPEFAEAVSAFFEKRDADFSSFK